MLSPQEPSISFRRITAALLLTISSLVSCASPQVWSLDSIAAGDELFDSSRLRYVSSSPYPNISFEMVRLGGLVESYLSLHRFRLPTDRPVKIRFETEHQIFEEDVQVHSGGMRLRLSSETTQKIIVALQAGEKVAILMDDFEETLNPNQFSSFYPRFTGEGHFFETILKGLVR